MYFLTYPGLKDSIVRLRAIGGGENLKGTREYLTPMEKLLQALFINEIRFCVDEEVPINGYTFKTNGIFACKTLLKHFFNLTT